MSGTFGNAGQHPSRTALSALRRTLLGVALLLSALPVLAELPPNGGACYTTDTDAMASAAEAPGVPSGSTFSDFGNNESVNLFNGNLNVAHATGPRYPMNGGRSIGLTRSFNSKNIRHDLAVLYDHHFDPEEFTQLNEYNPRFHGWSWVGAGWTMHLGRYYTKPKYHQGNYLHDFRYFVDPSGTEHQIRPAQLAASPILKEEFFPESYEVETVCPGGEICIYPEDSDCCTNSPHSGSPICQVCGCPDDCSQQQGDLIDIDHYLITQPDGTVYRLEQIVEPDIYTDRGWIDNTDRSGWYTTRITDLAGNEVQIEYYGETENPDYPEAIKTVKIKGATDPAFRTIITTDLWDSADPNYVADTDGTLRLLNVLLPNSQWASYTFNYTVYPVKQYMYDANDQPVWQTLSVPHLTSVGLPPVLSGTTGEVAYEYGMNSESGFQKRYLDRIRYPTGAVSAFGYDNWGIGERWEPCPHNNPWEPGLPPPFTECQAWFNQRTTTGVTRKWQYPEGDDAEKPYYQWTWFRDFTGSSCTSIDSNVFRLTMPDGRVVESEFYGHPLGDCSGGPIGEDFQAGLEGHEKTRITYDASGNAVRTERFVYDYSFDTSDPTVAPPGTAAEILTAESHVEYNDDDGSCFGLEAPPGAAPKTTSTYNYQRTDYHDWELSRTEGYYHRTPRVTFRDFEEPLDPCRLTNHVLHTADFSFVQEGDQRLESVFSHDCAGRLLTARSRDEKLTVTGECIEPSDGVWEDWSPCLASGNDAGDILETRTYGADLNVDQVTVSGADDYPDGTPTSDFVVDYEWNYGQRSKATIAGLGYPSSDLAIDPTGMVLSSTDANGLTTSYAYDALGRVTEIDPPGSVEYPTNIGYPTLNETVVVQSASGTTTYDPADPDQVFSTTKYDGLGRTIEVENAMPAGKKAVQVTRYDELGRVIFVSEWIDRDDYDSAAIGTWQVTRDLIPGGSVEVDYSVDYPKTAAGDPWGTVTFYGDEDPLFPGDPLNAIPDPLGRVRRVVAADGSIVDTNYCGPHREVVVHGVNGTDQAITRYYNDGNGRLVVVDPPEDGQAADAAYEYDIGGNLTEVNLLDLSAAGLTTDVFVAWRDKTLPGGQTRSFDYDGLGRLQSSSQPESGQTETHGYDVRGNPLTTIDAMGLSRGYFFRNSYDIAGRLMMVEKVLGTPSSPTPADENRLTGVGTGFETLTGWEEGTLDPSGTFVTGASDWKQADYASIDNCVAAPPNGGSYGLYLGHSCRYSHVDDTPQVMRVLTQSVERDDILTFKYWRLVREGAAGKDRFSVFVVHATEGNSTANRHTMLELDSAHASYARWRQALALRPADFFDGWGEAETRDLYVYFVFAKGDTATTGLGDGVLVDDVFLGQRGVETLAVNVYDADACQAGPDYATAACATGSETLNVYLGQLTHSESYADGRLVARTSSVYKGMNGRLSGQRREIDWAGVGESHEWNLEYAYEPHGWLKSRTGAYRLTDDSPRVYEQTYDRGALIGVEGQQQSIVTPFVSAVDYGPAGTPTTVYLGNGTQTTVAPDVMDRPASIHVEGPDLGAGGGLVTLWNSGSYGYDGAGNITAIGSQTFGYDHVGRLTSADVTGQAQNDPNLYSVNYEYDLYGNLRDRTWSNGGAGGTAPSGMPIQNRGHAGNRIGDPDFAYDQNGNMTRMASGISTDEGALWDARDRMGAFLRGGLVRESYLYDADGYRTVRYPQSNGGRPVITIRDDAGAVLSQYEHESGSAEPTLVKDFVYALGSQVAERTASLNAPAPLQTTTTFYSGGSYHFEVPGGQAFETYTVDIRAASGHTVQLTGVVLDANGAFSVDESNFSLGESNYVRVRIEGQEDALFGTPATLTIDPDVTAVSENQIVALAAHRKGTDIILRWRLLNENGSQTILHYDESGGGGAQLTPSPLATTVQDHTLDEQSMANQCVFFKATQHDGTQESSPNDGVDLPPPLHDVFQEPECDEVSPPGPDYYYFADSYHHRDHLGSLRVVTDASGAIQSGHDYYPFGMEIAYGSTAGGSRARYTGHERDEESQLDYMLARYCSSTLGGLLGVDPSPRSFNVGDPQSWNRYVYSSNNPLNIVDPDGEVGWRAVKGIWNVGKRVYKTARTSGLRSLAKPSTYGKAIKSEALDIVDNAATLVDGSAGFGAKALAALDLTTGFGDEAKALGRIVGIAKKPTMKESAQKIREAARHPAAANQRVIAVGEDAAGKRFAGSSGGFDRGQRAMADELGVERVPTRAGNHAEDNLLDAVPDLKRVSTDKLAPCPDCADKLARRGVEVE